MPFAQRVTTAHRRYLISGMPNTGKTTSLPTFLYGPYDYHTQLEEALEYAGNRTMSIISCPGEKGTFSLPDMSGIASYVYTTDSEEGATSVNWSRKALDELTLITKEVVKRKPDILAIDGLHALWAHYMNRTTQGRYLQGLPVAGDSLNPYDSGKLYGQAHDAFGQYVTQLYHASIPLIIATTWEEWDAGTQEQEAGKPQDIREHGTYGLHCLGR